MDRRNFLKLMGLGATVTAAGLIVPKTIIFDMGANTYKKGLLKAEYTMELAQDLKAIHGLDAEVELANILSSEILKEINREVFREIWKQTDSGLIVPIE
jgi:hypothetical protein